MSATLDALRRGVDNVPGGRPVIAVRTGHNDEVLRKKLSGAASHALRESEAVAIARVLAETGGPSCHDWISLASIECGGKFVPGQCSEAVTQSPMQRVSTLAREAGDVTGTFIDALADGVISDNELALIEREICEAEEALRKLRQAARAVNAAGKPRAAGAALTAGHQGEVVPA